MKYIYIGLILLLVSIVGCVPDDDYCSDYYTQGQIKGIEEGKDKISSITTELESQKSEVVRLKEDNLECKQNFLTNCSNTSGDYTTCVRQKANCEIQLEECWNEEHDNYKDLYRNCRDDRDDDKDKYNETIKDLEDDIKDLIDDLEDCEEDCS